MPKLQRFEIVLTNPQVVYWPGQFVEGQLHVDLSDDMKMRGMLLLICATDAERVLYSE